MVFTFVALSFADNSNEFFSSSQVGYTPFDDKVIAAFRAIIDGDAEIPGLATSSLAPCLFQIFFI